MYMYAKGLLFKTIFWSTTSEEIFDINRLALVALFIGTDSVRVPHLCFMLKDKLSNPVLTRINSIELIPVLTKVIYYLNP